MSLAKLTLLCPPPPTICDGFHLSREEGLFATYGLRFPEDYISFCKTYGTGGFVSPNSHDISIINIFSRHYQTMLEYGFTIINSFFDDKRMSERAQAQSLSVGSLFPLGNDTDDTYLNWITRKDPANWKILALNFERRFFEVFNLGLTDFLVDFFTGRLDVTSWHHRLEGGQVPTYTFEAASG